MRLFLAAIAAAILSACANDVGTAATEQRSGFSGARVVDISPHGMHCDTACLSLGAQWSSEHSDSVILKVAINLQIIGITSAKVNIDGAVTDLAPLPGLTNFDTSGSLVTSTHSFTAPLSLVRQMAAGQRVWVRVGTTKGYVDDYIIDGGRDTKALHALRRFLTQVDA
jgi:hypothetical protein